MNAQEYPYNQYTKNGKVNVEKVIADSNTLNDHILVRLLLLGFAEISDENKKLRAVLKKRTKAEDGEENPGVGGTE